LIPIYSVHLDATGVGGIDDWSFLSFVLPRFIPKAETELKVRGFRFLRDLDAGFIREVEIVEPVGNGIVEEGGHSEEPF